MEKQKMSRIIPAAKEKEPVFDVGDLVVVINRPRGPGSEIIPGEDVGIIIDIRESSGPMAGYIPFGYHVQWPNGTIGTYSSTVLMSVKSDLYTQ